jgi:hypothetical protein
MPVLPGGGLGMKFIRGLMFAWLFSIPIWALIIFVLVKCIGGG